MGVMQPASAAVMPSSCSHGNNNGGAATTTKNIPISPLLSRPEHYVTPLPPWSPSRIDDERRQTGLLDRLKRGLGQGVVPGAAVALRSVHQEQVH